MRYGIILLAVLALCSCRSTKKVETAELRDSAATHVVAHDSAWTVVSMYEDMLIEADSLVVTGDSAARTVVVHRPRIVGKRTARAAHEHGMAVARDQTHALSRNESIQRKSPTPFPWIPVLLILFLTLTLIHLKTKKL